MKKYFQKIFKRKKTIGEEIAFLINVGVFSLVIYFMDEYIGSWQCCGHYKDLLSFGGFFILGTFYYSLISYPVFRMTGEVLKKMSFWQKLFWSAWGVILYLPILGLLTLRVLFCWNNYFRWVSESIFSELIVGGIFLGSTFLLVTFLNYKYILFKKYTFALWSLISVGALSFLLYSALQERDIFVFNKIILILTGLFVLVVIIIDRYGRKLSVLKYVFLVGIMTFLLLMINFFGGVYFYYQYDSKHWKDFLQCQLNKKEWLIPWSIGMTRNGVCLDSVRACRIMKNKKKMECVRNESGCSLKFLKAKGEFIVNERNNKRGLDLRLIGDRRRIIVWRYRGIIRITPILWEATGVRFFTNDTKRGQYLTDGKYMYYGNRRIEADVDLNSFEYLGWRCAKDKKEFFYQGRVATTEEKELCLGQEEQ
jgi:hypothetical protein